MKKNKKIYFVILLAATISCQNNSNNTTTIDKSTTETGTLATTPVDLSTSDSDTLKVYETADNMMWTSELKNKEQIIFVLKKISQFRKLVVSKTSSDEIKTKANELSKSLLKDKILNWEGTITVFDNFKGNNADIGITIIDDYKVGERTITKEGEDYKFVSHVAIEAIQWDIPSKGYKGISRNSDIYKKISKIGNRSKVLFSAKVIDVTDGTEKTGINLLTSIIVELTDIKEIK